MFSLRLEEQNAEPDPFVNATNSEVTHLEVTSFFSSLKIDF